MDKEDNSIESNRKTYMNHERLRESIRDYHNQSSIHYHLMKSQLENNASLQQNTARGIFSEPSQRFQNMESSVLDSTEVNNNNKSSALRYLEPDRVPEGVVQHFRVTGINPS